MKSFSMIIILFFCTFFTYAHTNPLRRPSGKDSTVTATPAKPQVDLKMKLFRRLPFATEILAMQKVLSEKSSVYLRSIKEKPGVLNVGMLLLLAFIYGMLHSLGPGHAKLLFASHSLARPVTLREIWFSGTLFSLTHTGVALLLFQVVRLLLGVRHSTVEHLSHGMVNASGYLVCFAGLIVLFSEYLEQVTQRFTQRYFHGVSGIRTIAVSAGLAPCPGAFLILTFSSILGILPYGIAAIIALSIGMALTVSTVGTLSNLFSRTISSLKTGSLGSVIQITLRIFGGVLIILVGITMILH